MVGLVDAVDLPAVQVRPVRGAAKRGCWDPLVEAYHYLRLWSPFGATLRRVVELPDGGWAALFS